MAWRFLEFAYSRTGMGQMGWESWRGFKYARARSWWMIGSRYCAFRVLAWRIGDVAPDQYPMFDITGHRDLFRFWATAESSAGEDE